MNKETKAAPSQCLGCWIQVSSPQIYWIPACSKLGFKLVLGEPVQRCWSWICEKWLYPHTWVFVASAHSDQATQGTGELSLSVFSQIPPVILSVPAERASASLWRSALHRNLCPEVLFLCLHHSLLQVKFRVDRTLVKCSGARQGEQGWGFLLLRNADNNG